MATLSKKGHLMKRGTLMVLKRLLMTALGALSLSALATGPASAQQIPAPDAYGDPAACAAAITEMTATAGMGHPLDDADMDGNTDGMLTAAQMALLMQVARTCAGDVGAGVTKARSLVMTVTEAKAALDAAQEVYDADDSAGNLEDLTAAMTAHTAAVDARNAFSGGGTLYESVYIEEHRKAQAAAASTAWTEAYNTAQEAEALKDTAEVENFIEQFAGFDDNGAARSFEIFERAADDDNSVTAGTFIRIKNADGSYVVPDENGDLPFNTVSVFDHDDDVTGNGSSVTLRLETWDPDDDADTMNSITYVVVSQNSDVFASAAVTLGGEGADTVNARYMAAKDDLEAKTKAAEANQRPTEVARLAEEQQEAQARYDHFAAQKASAEKALRDGELTVLRGDDPETADDIETDFRSLYTVEEYEALMGLHGDADDAAAALKSAYDDQVAAKNDVEANLKDTQTYLEQLVKLREYEKGVADDAATAAEAEEETAGQMMANDNLTDAEAKLATFNELQALADENPVKALVNSLLEPKGEAGDDDGQALVDAIDATYQTANDAMTAVEGLGGPDGTVAQNTGAIAQETQDRVAADDALGMRIDTNWDAIAVNQTDIDALEAEDVRLEGRIDTNWDAIAVNQIDIDANEVAIAGNTTAIGNNTTSITSNSTMIGENASAISRNSGMITDNRNRIGELSDDLDIVRSGVAASMALAGMPAINGRGIAIGVGSFDGESAFAVGFQIQGEMASFQIGVTSSGGETGASAGVGFQF